MSEPADIIRHVIAMATATGDDSLATEVSNEVPEELIRHCMVTACILFDTAVDSLVEAGVIASKETYYQDLSLSALRTFGGD